MSSGLGIGNSGGIFILARDRILLDNSFIISEGALGSVGNSGNISIRAELLELLNGSRILTLSSGDGNSGDIKIDIFDDISISGILSEPGVPLNSNNIYVDGETDSTSAIPEPIETSKGKIQPARGIKVIESGKIILTAYRTNNAGERSPEIKPNCG